MPHPTLSSLFLCRRQTRNIHSAQPALYPGEHLRDRADSPGPKGATDLWSDRSAVCPWLCTSRIWVQPQVGCGKGPGHRTRVSGVTLQPPARLPNRVLSKLENTGLWSLRPPTEQVRGCHFPWVLASWGHTPGSGPLAAPTIILKGVLWVGKVLTESSKRGLAPSFMARARTSVLYSGPGGLRGRHVALQASGSNTW